MPENGHWVTPDWYDRFMEFFSTLPPASPAD